MTGRYGIFYFYGYNPVMKSAAAKTRLPVVLVPGWMMTGRCWEGVAARLQEHHPLLTVALPGHASGVAGHLSFARPDELVGALADMVTQPALWVGWSLGGLLVQALACRYPQCAAGVVCIAAPSRFVAGDDWPHAMKPAVFDDFAASFAHDAESAVARFLGWQAAGCDDAKAILRQLKDIVARPGQPGQPGQPGRPGREAAAGLRFLGDCDLREAMRDCDCRVDFVAGAADRLAPAPALAQSAGAAKRGYFHCVAGAGHAVVLSHPDAVCRLIEHHVEHHVERARAQAAT